MPVNVQQLDADWYSLSGRKVFAPTCIGALYGADMDALAALRRIQSGHNLPLG